MTQQQNEARRILIHRVGHLGDTIIALPSFWAIRRNFPQAHIALLSNRYADRARVAPASVLPSEGLIDEWLEYRSNDRSGNPIKLLPLLASLRRRAFDTLVYLAPRLRRPVEVRRDLAFFRLAGIRNLIGNQGFASLRNGAASGNLPTVEHEADHLLHRLSLSGIPVPAPGEAKIDLALTGEEERSADSWMRQNVGEFSDHEIIAFGAGSKWPSKVWPEDRFAEVGRRLIEERGVFPIVFGGPEDRSLAGRLIAGWNRGANVAGVLPVRHAAAALSRCALYVGNDTGTMHLAAAVGTPCVVTMSAQDWPGRWNPYGPGHTVLRRRLPCEGCMLPVCETEGLRCLKEIGVDEVLDACARALSRHEVAKQVFVGS